MLLHRRHLIGGNGQNIRAGHARPASSSFTSEIVPEESPAATFGLWVWARRKALKRSRREVARRARLREATLRALETGTLSLEETLAVLPALAHGLDLSPACLQRRWYELVVARLLPGIEEEGDS